MTDIEAYETVKAFVENHAPQLPHKGLCGPESGCDCTCADMAYLGEAMSRLRRLVEEMADRHLW